MHELALMTSLVDRVCEIAKNENAKKITAINVKRGELSGVIPEALNFCFDICVADTLAENSKLNIIDIKAKWKCDSCGKIISKADVEDEGIPICPNCGNYKLTLIEGKDFQLASIEIE